MAHHTNNSKNKMQHSNYILTKGIVHTRKLESYVIYLLQKSLENVIVAEMGHMNYYEAELGPLAGSRSWNYLRSIIMILSGCFDLHSCFHYQTI